MDYRLPFPGLRLVMKLLVMRSSTECKVIAFPHRSRTYLIKLILGVSPSVLFINLLEPCIVQVLTPLLRTASPSLIQKHEGVVIAFHIPIKFRHVTSNHHLDWYCTIGSIIWTFIGHVDT